VQSGDNWFTIAQSFGLTQEALAAANGTTPSDILQVDQELRIPVASGAEASTSQPASKPTLDEATASPVQTYVVQRGDNWFTIAKRFNVTQEDLAAYNDRSAADILQVNQKLRVPPVGATVTRPTPTVTPTRIAKPTPTETSEPTPVPPAVVRLTAPVLLTPMNGDGFASGALPLLTWQPVRGFGEDDVYYVRVSFTMRNGEKGFAEGDTTTPSFTMPQWVFDAALPPDRISSWSVQVVRRDLAGETIQISPASESRTFYWR
jgi:LysM repeat protein